MIRRAVLLATAICLASGAAFAQPKATSAASDPDGPPGLYTDPKTGNVLAGTPDFVPKTLLTTLPADAPKPTADPRNFEGVWIHDQTGTMFINVDAQGKPVPITEKGKRIRDRRRKAGYSGTPYINASILCLPPGEPWQLELNMPFRIFQAPRYMVFGFEEFHDVWNIRMSDHHQPGVLPSYMGDSIAHWDGNTLVVDTTNFKAPFWVDGQGTPVTAKGHLIQRIVKTGSELQIITTVDDKEMYTRPWSFVRTYAWHPDLARFKEYNCEQQIYGPGGVSSYGAVPEPADNK